MNDKLQIVTRPNPFDHRRKLEALEIRPGAPLAHYLQRYPRENVVVRLNGEIIPPERFDKIVPRPAQELMIMPRVAGQVGRLLTMIAAIVIAAVLPFTTQLTGFWLAMATAGVMIAGTLIATYAFPMPGPQNKEEPSTYGWNGPVATLQQGATIPKLYGKVRVNLGGWPLSSYTTASGHQMTLDALYSLGWGKLKAITGVRINDNDLANYPGASVETRMGLVNQTPISYFSTQHNQRPQNSRLRSGAGFTEIAGDRADTQGIIAQFFFPRGVWYLNGKGEYVQHHVNLTLRWRKQGDVDWQSQQYTYWDSHPTPVYVEMRADGLPAGKYDVQASKEDWDWNREDQSKWGTECWLRALDELVYDDLAYPNIAQFAFRAVATDKLSGNIQVSVLAESEDHPGTTAGTQLAAFYTTNPAVICWDALTNKLYGAGIDPKFMDEDAFAEWAAWCDELVPNGSGGTIKRATWNGLFSDNSNVWDFVQMVAMHARSVVLRVGAMYTVISDKAQPVTQLFTVANIKAGSFRESWLPMDGRANSITVYYYDETDDYQRKPVTVEDQDAIAAGKDIIPSQPVDLKGCTTKAHAWRHAMYLLRSNKYLLRSAEWEAPADAVACIVGDVVGVQHDVPRWGTGGRIVACAGVNVTLDQPVTMEAGKQYVLSVMLATVQRVAGHISNIVGNRVSVPEFNGASNVTRLVTATKDVEIIDFGNGWVDVASAAGLAIGNAVTLHDVSVLETKSVTTVAGTSANLAMQQAFSADPQPFDVYAFGETDAQMKLFRVLQTSKSRDQEVAIKAVEYRPEIIADLEPVLAPDAGPNANQIAVTNLEAQEFGDPTPDTPAIAAGWQPGPLTEGAYIYAVYGVFTPAIALSGVNRNPNPIG